MDIFFSIIEYVGVISFAISGTLFALNKKADIIGALLITVLTCFGGGMLRDFALGIVPPNLLANPAFWIQELVAIGICILLFHISFSKRVLALLTKHQHDFWLEVTDAIGLAVFLVIGVDYAIESGFQNNIVMLVFCGCITSVGGGMLRDICTATIPRIFCKHVYLLPCILGAIFYVFTKNENVLGHIWSTILTMTLVILVRVLACIYKWNLPRPVLSDAQEEKRI